MKVVVPYIVLNPATELVLRPYKPQYVDVSAPDAYRTLFQTLWVERQTTIIVEHDIVPWPGALEELWQCPCQWGAYSYLLRGGVGVYHGFGCTKLTRELMLATPDVWSASCEWNKLDQHLLFEARSKGCEPHHHRPAVVHLNERYYPERPR